MQAFIAVPKINGLIVYVTSYMKGTIWDKALIFYPFSVV